MDKEKQKQIEKMERETGEKGERKGMGEKGKTD